MLDAVEGVLDPTPAPPAPPKKYNGFQYTIPLPPLFPGFTPPEISGDTDVAFIDPPAVLPSPPSPELPPPQVTSQLLYL